jgi:uncharacterized protein YbjT (DUF2867 family)
MENQSKKTAIISGATGLVGGHLLTQLLSDPDYVRVIAVVRKPMEIKHEKLEQLVIDFRQLPEAMEGVQADHGFCCLGTTLKTAGSKEKQYKIDHDYVVTFARGCHRAGVSRFGVISSIGAKTETSNFYLRTKGEMERDVMSVPFTGIFILRPSFLLGERKEFRAGEKAVIAVMKVINPLMIGGLRKYRGVQASAVSRFMIEQLKTDCNGIRIAGSEEIK